MAIEKRSVKRRKKEFNYDSKSSIFRELPIILERLQELKESLKYLEKF